MATPYIGITGFTHALEVDEITETCDKLTLSNTSDYTAMLGFICSAKRLAIPDTPGTQSPAFYNLPGLLERVPERVLPMIHYFTPHRQDLSSEVQRVFEPLYDDGLCKALQLNQEWPDLDQVRSIKDKMPDMKIVLQIPPSTLKTQTALQIGTRAMEYEGLADYVLVDPSGGEGKELDVKQTSTALHVLGEALRGSTLGIAGGLGPHNIEDHVMAIKRTLPRSHEQNTRPFCVDAQGRLRTEDKRRINLDLARAYLTSAARALREQEE